MLQLFQVFPCLTDTWEQGQPVAPGLEKGHMSGSLEKVGGWAKAKEISPPPNPTAEETCGKQELGQRSQQLTPLS